MQDLVQLMTQTLHMEKEAGEKQQKPACEFRLHRKYRDTLLLHGKAQEEEPEQICLQEFHADHLTVPEKFRRMVEALRADVVQELGVKLLEKVYDDLEEEDESERELRLKRHLGHRYSNFSLKIRQLKFFEENSTF
ncbi:serine/threonine-protein kinase Nek4-like [Rhinophrynus dorsalis]